MAHFTSDLSSTVIFLFTEHAEHGQIPIGTGFVIAYPVPDKPGTIIPLIVTAKHVIGDHKRIVGRYSTKSGTSTAFAIYDLEDLRRNGDVWEHPNDGVDLIVFRTLHYKETDYKAIPLDFIASREIYQEEEISITDRIIFPCLLVNFMGSTRNYPVMRDGSIALICDEPIPLEYAVGDRHISTTQQLILIDATSIAGASGSPIFLWPGPRIKGQSFHVGGSKPWLLGLMHGFYTAIPREVREIQTEIMIPSFAEKSGIAIIFPSWHLLEILNSDEVSKRIDVIANPL